MNKLSVFLLALGMSGSVLAASNANGPILEFTDYVVPPSSQYKLEQQKSFSEIYPLQPKQEALADAIQRFEDEGQPPSDRLVGVKWGNELRVSVADREVILKRISSNIVRENGEELAAYTDCTYPMYGDQKTEWYAGGHYKVQIQTSVEKYYPQYYSKMTQGVQLLDLEKNPSNCMKTEKSNTFANGYIDLFKDGEKLQTVTIIVQDFTSY